ncbi:MAG TPA: methyltransferase domain-containing protein [Gemmatimonadaceae bacterium]
MLSRPDVSAFYDEFLESRMLRYRLFGSPRLERAARRITAYIKPGDRVLDVGCGIGIITERIARLARDGQVWGVDLSPRNAWYAGRTVRGRNVAFFAADVLSETATIRERTGGRFDVITMVDVIEHIPVAGRAALFATLRELSAGRALLILTYPSPQYQRYLQANQPQELQIIDNIVELPTLLDEAGAAGYSLQHFSLETVRMPNRYVHCVLQTDAGLAAPAVRAPTLGARSAERVRRTVRDAIMLPLRRWRYVTRVMRAEATMSSPRRPTEPPP